MKPKVSFVSAFVTGFLGGGVLSYSAAWALLMATQVVLLSLLTQSSSRRNALLLVFLHALGGVLASNFWLGVAIYHPPVNGLLSACVLSGGILLLHALSYMCVTALLLLFCKSGARYGTPGWGVCLAVAWTLAEVARSVGFWAMPWGLMGYAHLDNPLLAGLYPIIGGHGVAGVSWLLAAGLLESATRLLRQRAGAGGLRRRTAAMPVIALAMVLAASAATSLIDWTQPSGQALTVRLIHTDLPGNDKYTPEARELALRQLRQVAAQGGADLSVFPELYVAENPGDIDPGFRREVVEAVRRGRGSLVFGSPADIVAPGVGTARYNTLVQITADGDTRLYAKELLLPFSEYLPRSPVLSWAYPYLYRYPQADLTPGDGQEPPFEVAGIRLGLSICSELAYAGKASRQARDAGLLVNASSDSWVPSGAYLAQAHLIARVRAAEAQKPMVRANNVGYSAFIDERGRVVSATSGDGTTGLMPVQARSGNTPYVRLASAMANGG